MSKTHPKGVSTFDPNSRKAREGLKFQKQIYEELLSQFPDHELEEVWDYFKRQNPNLSIYELACLEKSHGDITFVLDGQRFWVECCYIIAKQNAWFCEMKRLKFRGQNKWYCWGKIDEPGKSWFILSRQWNKYVKHCRIARDGRKQFRVVPKHLIGDNLRVARKGVQAFVSTIT